MPISSAVRSTGPAVIPCPTTIGAETPAAERDSRTTYRCPACEHVLRVMGLGRHRVYFQLTDEQLDDPVMDRVCPGCGHGLPVK